MINKSSEIYGGLSLQTAIESIIYKAFYAEFEAGELPDVHITSDRNKIIVHNGETEHVEIRFRAFK